MMAASVARSGDMPTQLPLGPEGGAEPQLCGPARAGLGARALPVLPAGRGHFLAHTKPPPCGYHSCSKSFQLMSLWLGNGRQARKRLAGRGAAARGKAAKAMAASRVRGEGRGRLTGQAVYAVVQGLGEGAGVRAGPQGLRLAAITARPWSNPGPSADLDWPGRVPHDG
jgi:hypothetical protein